MSVAMLLCGTCDGQHKAYDQTLHKMVTCPDCNGAGSIPDTTAVDSLIDDLAPLCGREAAAEVLVWLSSHPAELNAWMEAVGHLRYTGKALTPRPRDSELHPYHADYVRPGTMDVVGADRMGPNGRLLFTVAGA